MNDRMNEIRGEMSEAGAKRYSRIKIRLSFADLAVTFAFISVLAFSGISRDIVAALKPFAADDYVLFMLFLLSVGTASGILGLPLDFYGSYIVEHRYGLSHQGILQWLGERCKSIGVGLVLGIPVALAFYYFLKAAGGLWWLYFGSLVFIIAVVLARIAPTVIYPLFYRFTPLQDEALARQLAELLDSHHILFRGIYTFNMSKDTRKANAGFTGIGRGKRIILSDTLIENFTPAEIRVIFAHELGHYLGRHISKNIILSGIVIFVTFFLCGRLYDTTLAAAGYAFVYDIAALPILLFYLSLFSLLVMPLTNIISRAYEREADLFALRIGRDRESFISSMEKLARLNLADMDPHPAIEFLFYGHPSIRKRIEFARAVEIQEPEMKSLPEK
jgi:STE24 endopeptidase